MREAHPTDGWRSPGNDRVGITITQPKNAAERQSVAHRCSGTLEISMPLLVDEMDDRVGHRYSGMPDRLYVIDQDGRVAYKSGRGPFGFKPGEMEQSLVMLLLDRQRQERFVALTNDEAWKRLPPAEKGAGWPLPAWARVLAASLPHTTAGMLELECLHRTKSPLSPILRAKVRLAVARANRCAYSEAYAADDLQRAFEHPTLRKLVPGDINLTKMIARELRLADDSKDVSSLERAVLAFARKLTQAAYTVTDAEVEELTQLLGEEELTRRLGSAVFAERRELVRSLGQEQLVALVLLVAYANFQDRLLLALDVPVEPGGPLPPEDIRFRKGAVTSAVRPGRKDTASPNGNPPPTDAAWLALNFDQLQQRMEQQRSRPARIRVPTWEEASRSLPPERRAGRPTAIRWSLVCYGYQPELTAAWLGTMGTFGQEARQDRVFEESLFWVITRELQCFY